MLPSSHSNSLPPSVPRTRSVGHESSSSTTTYDLNFPIRDTADTDDTETTADTQVESGRATYSARHYRTPRNTPIRNNLNPYFSSTPSDVLNSPPALAQEQVKAFS